MGKAIGRFFGRVRKGSLMDIAILVCVAALVIVGIAIAALSNRIFPTGPKSSSSQGTPLDGPDSSSSSSISSALPASSDTNSEPPPQAPPLDKDEYDGTILPETPDGGQEYVDDTLFLGDSNTYRLATYGLTSWQNNLSAVSMGIQHVTSKACMYFDGVSNAVLTTKAVAMMQPLRILITYGTNNTQWKVNTFIEQYRIAVDAIIKEWPYADIIINAIPPLGSNRSNAAQEQRTTNEFNKALADFAKEEGYQFLNSTEALQDPATGYARQGYMEKDGLHLTESGAKALIDYVRTHAHDAPDIRPALKNIPTHRPTPEETFNPQPDPASSSEEEAETVEVRFSITQGKEYGVLSGTLTQKIVPGQYCSSVTLTLNEGCTAQWGCTEGSIERGLSVSEDKRVQTITFTVPPTDSTSIDIWASITPGAPSSEPSSDPVSSDPAVSDTTPSSDPTVSDPSQLPPPTVDVPDPGTHVHVWGNWYNLGDGTHQGVCVEPGCPDPTAVSAPQPHEWGETQADGTHTCIRCFLTELDPTWAPPAPDQPVEPVPGDPAAGTAPDPAPAA